MVLPEAVVFFLHFHDNFTANPIDLSISAEDETG